MVGIAWHVCNTRDPIVSRHDFGTRHFDVPRQHRRVIVSSVSRVHDVLKWANRREVAREVTLRGYRVSGETLNRWVRDEEEFPAIVERIVYELFTISGQQETPPPWAEAMHADLVEKILANQETVVQKLVEQTARIGLEQALDEQPPAAPAPGKRATMPARAGRGPRR